MWDCETCREQQACMTQILAGQAFSHTACNPPVPVGLFTTSGSVWMIQPTDTGTQQVWHRVWEKMD